MDPAKKAAEAELDAALDAAEAALDAAALDAAALDAAEAALDAAAVLLVEQLQNDADGADWAASREP